MMSCRYLLSKHDAGWPWPHFFQPTCKYTPRRKGNSVMETWDWFVDHWEIKLVSAVLIWAAYIDGRQLRVPNWMTYPLMLSGLLYGFWQGGWNGLGHSALGLIVGLLCLLPLYSVGGMGAGDVKLMAGMGAWVGAATTWYAFCVSVVVGAFMAVIMAWWRGKFAHHLANFTLIWHEWLTIRDPVKLAEIAAERKPRMLLLPYGIPICIGSLLYFAYAGLL
ncbi:MAG: prepilin peptidase [Planctomycetaceae bacterium]|nr:MAG: prepilin peptidase [Planctomycetaceae bacterium]